MKKLFLLFAISSVCFAQMTIIQQDTLRFRRDSNATVYTAGDIVRYYPSATGGYLFSFPVESNRGKITEVALFADTANVTTSTFTVMFFSDTTDLYANDGIQLPADNAAFQLTFPLTKYYIGQTQLVFTMYGTTAGGATAAGDINTGLAINYVVPGSRIYFVVLADAAYTPKAGGLFRVHIKTEQNF